MKFIKKLNPITQKRINSFLKIRRSYYSLIGILLIYFVSLFSNFIANDKPLLIFFEGKAFFPILKFYPAKNFEGSLNTEPDYKKLKADGVFTDHLIIFPIIPYGVNESDLQDIPPAAPSSKHILGTDDRGRDVLTRLLYGFRISVSFALLIVLISNVNAIIIGSIQGYFSGRFDMIFQRMIEIIATLPFLYVIIILGTVLGQSFMILILAFTLFSWIGLSYYMRAEYLRLRKIPFVEASKVLGVSNIKIMFLRILPNALIPIITFFPFEIIAGISSLSALDYLGFGLPAPTPSWGELMRQGMENLESYWLSIFPFIALFITLLLISFIGEGVREAFNPVEYSKME